MCGILFCHHKKEMPISNSRDIIFTKALEKMKYRGPDHTGFYQIGNNYFGHVRLSIIDAKESSNQPFYDAEFCMLFNGEIYNYKLIDSTSYSDTKTLFNLLKRKGLVDKIIEGMYSILFFDRKENKISLIRDFFGEKPLYKYEDNEVLIISSTIKSIQYILQNQNKLLSINQNAVDDMLLFGFIREPDTIYNEIRTMESGYTHTISLDNYNWSKRFSKPDFYFNWASANQYIHNSISATDFKPVLLLSAGIDSGYIATQIKERKLSASYCIYKSPISEKDESARAIEHLMKIDSNAKYQLVENSIEDEELFKTLFQLQEQPGADGIQIVNILTALTKTYPATKVILTGLGGDELFGGYNSFSHFRKYETLNWFNKGFEFLTKNNKYNRFFTNIIPDKDIISYYYRYRIDSFALNLLPKDRIQENFKRYKTAIPFNEITSNSSIQLLKICEGMDYMRNQLNRVGDNISMHFGLENRNPLQYYKSLKQEEINRRSFKNHQEKDYKISFKQKQGFTYGENKKKNHPYFIEEIKRINRNRQLLDNKFFEGEAVKKLEAHNFIRSSYMLLKWIEDNS